MMIFYFLLSEIDVHAIAPQPPWLETGDSGGGGDSKASVLPPEFEVESPNAIRFLVVVQCCLMDIVNIK